MNLDLDNPETHPERVRQQLAEWFDLRARAIHDDIRAGRRVGLPEVSTRWRMRWLGAAHASDRARNAGRPARHFGNDYDARMARKVNQLIAQDLNASTAREYGALVSRVIDGRVTPDEIAHVRGTADALDRDRALPEKTLRKVVRFARHHDRVLSGATFTRGEGLNFP